MSEEDQVTKLAQELIEARNAATDIFNAYIELCNLIGINFDDIQSDKFTHQIIVERFKLYLEGTDGSQG